MEKLPISLVVITLNESAHLKKCILSVPFASEVVVVDSISQDGTQELAKNLGAKVIERQFTNYREQKQFASDQASQPWVLSLDADEHLSTELQEEIYSLFKNGAVNQEATNSFRMPRLSYHLGRWIRHGGWYPDYQTRLFRKDGGRWVGDKLHEKFEATGQCVTLKSNLLHDVFENLETQIKANNRFSTLGAHEYFDRGVRFSFLKILLRPVGKFFECYVLKAGFLDGVPGFVIALGAAHSLFLRYSKLWELENSSKN